MELMGQQFSALSFLLVFLLATVTAEHCSVSTGGGGIQQADASSLNLPLIVSSFPPCVARTCRRAVLQADDCVPHRETSDSGTI